MFAAQTLTLACLGSWATSSPPQAVEPGPHPWATSNWCGYALAPYGDWNGDGHDDFLVSTPRDFEGDPRKCLGNEFGSVGVVSGADGRLLLAIRGPRLSGCSLAALDDLDGDGLREILIDTRVHDGRTGTLRFDARDDSERRMSTACRPIPDVDWDRVTDLVLVSGMNSHSFGSQSIALLSGTNGEVIRTLCESHDAPGVVAVGLPDVDDDGTSDVVAAFIGPWHDSGPRAELRLLSGADGRILARRALDVVVGWPRLALIPAGDVNGDDKPDLAYSVCYDSIASGHEPQMRGRVWVAAAATLETIHDLSAPNAEFRYGYALGGGFDLDRDAFPDVLVTEWGDMFDNDAARQLRVYSGRDGSLLRRHYSNEFCFQDSGRSVSWVGDVDSDCVPDYATGGSNIDTTSLVADGVTVFSGATGKVILTVP